MVPPSRTSLVEYREESPAHPSSPESQEEGQGGPTLHGVAQHLAGFEEAEPRAVRITRCAEAARTGVYRARCRSRACPVCGRIESKDTVSQYARPFVEAVHWIERQLGSATESGDDRRLQTITLTMEVPAGASDALSLRAYTLVLSDALTTFAESSPWFQPIRTRHGRLGRMQTTRSDVLGLGGLDYGWQNATPHAHLLVYGEVVGLAKIRRLWAEALRRAWDRAAAGKLIRKRLGIPRTLFAALRPRSGRPARVEVQVRPLGENPLRTVRRSSRSPSPGCIGFGHGAVLTGGRSCSPARSGRCAMARRSLRDFGETKHRAT
jgi:hypothetical protein